MVPAFAGTQKSEAPAKAGAMAEGHQPASFSCRWFVVRKSRCDGVLVPRRPSTAHILASLAASFMIS